MMVLNMIIYIMEEKFNGGRMKKLIVSLVFFLFISINLFAGWERTYGGTGSDEGWSVQQTSDGGYIITGQTNSFGAGDNDIYLIKTSSNGDTIWTKTYGSSESECGHSVQQTTDGGYIVAAQTNSFGAGGTDVYLIKTTANGDTVWTETYGGTNQDFGWSVQQTSDGGYIIAGRTNSFGAGETDVYLIKTTSNGYTLWTKTYGGTNSEEGMSVQQTPDGGYIIAGKTNSFGVAGSVDVYLIKTTSNGDAIWTRTYGGFGWETGMSVQQTSDGGYIIAGSIDSFGVVGLDVYLIKTNSIGGIVWTRIYGGSGWESGMSVQQTSDGGYIVAGNTDSYGAGEDDVYLIKTNKNGDTVWTCTYGGIGWDYARSAQQTSDGGYIITGQTVPSAVDYSDVYLIKTDKNGVIVEETIISIPSNFSYSIDQISDNMTLQFSLPENSNIEFNIYDAAGRYISTPIVGNYSAGVHSVNFQTDKRGVYFFNLKATDFSENGKFIVF